MQSALKQAPVAPCRSLTPGAAPPRRGTVPRALARSDCGAPETTGQVQELGDAAIAISQVNQSYYWSPIVGHHSSTAGSIFNDTSDDCDVFADPMYVAPACIVLDPVVPWPPRGAILEGI